MGNNQVEDGLTTTGLERIKREAKRLKKSEGIPHHQALEVAAKAKGWESYQQAHQAWLHETRGNKK